MWSATLFIIAYQAAGAGQRPGHLTTRVAIDGVEEDASTCTSYGDYFTNVGFAMVRLPPGSYSIALLYESDVGTRPSAATRAARRRTSAGTMMSILRAPLESTWMALVAAGKMGAIRPHTSKRISFRSSPASTRSSLLREMTWRNRLAIIASRSS